MNSEGSHSGDHATSHDESHGHDDHIHPAPRFFLTRYVFSTDHKVIGIQFLFSSLLFFILGGLMALAVRWQLAWPWSRVPILSDAMEGHWKTGGQMPPEFYNK